MKNYVIPVICAVAGVAVGAIGGFLFAKSKYKKEYEEKANKEIKEYIDHYEKKHAEDIPKEETKENWKEEALKNFPKDEWMKAVGTNREMRTNYNKKAKDLYDKSTEEEPEVSYSLEKDEEENGDDPDWEHEEFDDPYLITPDEHYEVCDKWEQVEMNWNAESGVLSDVDGNIYPYPEDTCGFENLQHFVDHPDSGYFIRNERDGVDYSINLVDY